MSAPQQTDDHLVAITSAVIAVLAALGSLFAHHKSIQALAIKNEALHDTIKASDQYAYYQAKRVRISVYGALIAAGVARDARGRENLESAVDHEETASLAVLGDAKGFEAQAEALQHHSEVELQSFETFEVATTLFEISIVLASISALTRTRALLWTAGGLSAIGIVLMVAAYVVGR